MRFIPTRVHGVFDYIIGLLLISCAWLFNFADGGVERWVTLVLGAALIIYSFMTDYEMGMFPLLPLPAHLAVDVLGGVLLIASPWIFGFAIKVWLPHVLLGSALIAKAVFTQCCEAVVETPPPI